MIHWEQVFLTRPFRFTVGCLLISWMMGYKSVSTVTTSSPTLIPWSCGEQMAWAWCKKQRKTVYFLSREWTVSVMSLLMFSPVIVPEKGDSLLCVTTVKRKADEAAASDSEWTHNKAQLRKSEVFSLVLIRLLVTRLQDVTGLPVNKWIIVYWAKKYSLRSFRVFSLSVFPEDNVFLYLWERFHLLNNNALPHIISGQSTSTVLRMWY